MALQLLKRNYVMQGYEQPKILKLPQGEERWAPRRLPVDVGDVMMNVRMTNGKNRFIQEHVSKYAQGLNPYGEYGYPYKVNKNFRPPILDPKFYEPLSRMPVKFDAVTAGPIVKDLYGKKIQINKVAPKATMDKICPDAGSNPSLPIQVPTNEQSREKELFLKQPKPTIPYHPSMPVYTRHPGTGVPKSEINPSFVVRPNMGIHFPYHVSDQSRDVRNMRTPTHVATASSLKIPGTTIDNEYLRQGPDLTPKIQTAAWYNPSYFLTKNSGYDISNVDTEKCIQDNLNVSGRTNTSWVNQEAERGVTKLEDPIHAGSFEGKAYMSQIDQHPEFQRIQSGIPTQRENFSERFVTEYSPNVFNNNQAEHAMNSRAIRDNLPRAHGELQDTRVDRTYLG
jgi:hypothetical protein